MSEPRLPALRPLVPGSVALGPEDREAPAVQPEKADNPPVALPWESAAERSAVESELKTFCADAELVYAAVVDSHGAILNAFCTVGARPHNEEQIGRQVKGVLASVTALGEEVGEGDAAGLSFTGDRWSYTLEPLAGGRLLFGIYPSSALPAIVRAGAKKCLPALESALNP